MSSVKVIPFYFKANNILYLHLNKQMHKETEVLESTFLPNLTNKLSKTEQEKVLTTVKN